MQNILPPAQKHSLVRFPKKGLFLNPWDAITLRHLGMAARFARVGTPVGTWRWRRSWRPGIPGLQCPFAN